MKFSRVMAFVSYVAALGACDPAVDASLISSVPADAATMALAGQALDDCAATLPDFPAAVSLMSSRGLMESEESAELRGRANERARIYESANGIVEVIIARRGNETVCIVAVKGMTPAQSFALAEPVADRFGSITNAERDNGLAANAVEAWLSSNNERTLFIAAYRTWPDFEEPGAAVRLIVLPR